MDYEAELREAIAATLANEVKAYDLVQACIRFGLAGGDESEAFGSKTRYVKKRLEEVPIADLIRLGEQALLAYDGYRLHVFRLKEAVRFARAEGRRRMTELTRRNLCDELALMGPLQGKLEANVFVAKLWPVDEMSSRDGRHRSFSGELIRHMIMNDDWSPSYLLDRLGVYELSDDGFGEFIEALVHPTVRDQEEQQRWVSAINRHIGRDGFQLTVAGDISGFPYYRCQRADSGVGTAPKNLIFASNGPKPQIVLVDAIHNDLRVVKYADYCLFFDRAIPSEGLRWHDLVTWWGATHPAEKVEEVERALYRRLLSSLASSPAERVLFDAYYRGFKHLGERLPALIPQVYLHFDPQTLRELHGEKRLERQRMDFLLLLSHGRRIVIEVDGAQHYSVDGRADPSRYAAMVEADRQLRLCGYEVYRFGGAELTSDDTGTGVARAFFEKLLKRYDLC